MKDLQTEYQEMFLQIAEHSLPSADRYRAFARKWQKGRFPKRIPRIKKKVYWAKNLPQDKIQECLELRDQGKSVHYISAVAELHHQTVRKIFKHQP